jgi:hypothetical protein
MRPYYDIRVEHMVLTALMVAQLKEGKRQCHFNFDV